MIARDESNSVLPRGTFTPSVRAHAGRTPIIPANFLRQPLNSDVRQLKITLSHFVTLLFGSWIGHTQYDFNIRCYTLTQVL